MEWILLGILIILLLPLYIYICSKSAAMGVLMAFKQLLSKAIKEEQDGKAKDKSNKE